MELSTVHVLALIVAANATLEHGGLVIDELPDNQRLIFRALLARELIEVHSPRRALIATGMYSYADEAGPDVYRVTDLGGELALSILSEHRAGG